MRATLRHMIRRDYAEVAEIDKHCFADPICVDGLIRELRQSNVIGMIAEVPALQVNVPLHNETIYDIAGYMIYQLAPRDAAIQLKRLAVSPSYRRMGVGRTMLRKLTEKLLGKYRLLTFDVPDTELPVHQWLRACGWKAAPLWRGADVYRFRMEVVEQECAGIGSGVAK